MVRFKTDEISRPRDVLEEQIGETDHEFWGNENMIIPDEPIEKTIMKLGRRNNIFSEQEIAAIRIEEEREEQRLPSLISKKFPLRKNLLRIVQNNYIMIMTKIKTVFLFRAVPLFLVLLVTGAGNEDPFIEYLRGQFDEYNKDYNIERAYLLTDRFVYRPGEDVWFKGFASNPDARSNSEDFFIRLYE